VCHQSVGLIAREIESRGVPTVSLTSAWSITAAAFPPRAAFLDYPLGHTSGRPFALDEQTAICQAALRLVETATRPGEAIVLPYRWGDDAWRADPLRGDSAVRPRAGRPSGGGGGDDNRNERHATPQYQSPEDARLAAERHGGDVACVACVGFDD
jgi:hypothetical protein